MARQVDSGYQGRVEIFQTKGTEHLFGLNEFEKGIMYVHTTSPNSKSLIQP